MQNPVPEFWKGSIISEKPGYLSEKWNFDDELQLPLSLIFLAESLHTFPI